MDETQGKEKPGSLEVINAALANFFDSLKDGSKKLSVADAIRLIELKKQLEIEQIHEVKVTWVEPSKGPFAISR